MNEKDKRRLEIFDNWLRESFDNNRIVILGDIVAELSNAIDEANAAPNERYPDDKPKKE